MLRKLFITLVILGIYNTSYSQWIEKDSDDKFYMVGEQLNVNNTVINSFGVRYDHFIGEKVSLNYRVSMGISDRNDFYFRSSSGLLLMAFLLESFFYYDFFFVIPDGLTYHLKLNETTTIEPYINFLAFEYCSSLPEYTSFSLETGVRFNSVFQTSNNIIYIAPFFGIKGYYASDNIGVFGGVSVSIGK